MAWTEQDYQEIVARLMASSIGVNEVPNADKADDVTSLPAFKPSGNDSKSSVVNYPLEFLKGEQGEPGIQGEPGKSFKVAGEYATLEALKSAVPDGSAVDGFMAVGTEAPYDYYAWVNGEWVSQGKIAGGNVINFPSALLNLTSGSESSEILSVFGGLDALRATIAKLRSDNCIIVCGNKNGNYTYVFDDYHVNYTDENNFKLSLFDISGKSSINVDFLYMIVALVDGVAEIASKKKHSLVKDSDVLTKTNTSSFTPTGDYQPATKKYVDDAAKPYIINSNGAILNKWINNTVITGAGVQGLANELFGSFKGFTEDYCSGKYTSLRFSTRHYDEEAGNYFGYIINANIQYCLSEPGNGYFELLFTFGYGSTLKSCYIYYYDVSETSNENKIVITDVVRSDNLTTLTKKTAAEYEAIGSKDANTAYCVTD